MPPFEQTPFLNWLLSWIDPAILCNKIWFVLIHYIATYVSIQYEVYIKSVSTNWELVQKRVSSSCFSQNRLINSTGKSLSEALIFASTNPKYDDRLFIVHENCKLRIPAEHAVYTNCCFCFDIQNNFGTQHVLQMLRASEKDLPVLIVYRV